MIKNFTSLSQLLVSTRKIPLIHGTLEGCCAFCGIKGTDLYTLQLKKTFTRADYLHDTGLICPACKHLYETQDYRKRNWLLTTNSFSFLHKSDVLPALQSLKVADLPFVIYTTSTYKKQGWLNLLNTLNYSLNRFTLAYDMQLLSLTSKQLKEHITKAEQFRLLGISKQELLSSIVNSKNLYKLTDIRTDLSFLKSVRKNLIWKWVINFVK